jgi:hypothetical protein
MKEVGLRLDAGNVFEDKLLTCAQPDEILKFQPVQTFSL